MTWNNAVFVLFKSKEFHKLTSPIKIKIIIFQVSPRLYCIDYLKRLKCLSYFVTYCLKCLGKVFVSKNLTRNMQNNAVFTWIIIEDTQRTLVSAKLSSFMGYWWTVKFCLLFYSEKGLKGAQIPNLTYLETWHI